MSAPIIPTSIASGIKIGTTYIPNNTSTAAATPGHNRSGFWGVGVAERAISDSLVFLFNMVSSS
jgi:hypothetical protein